MTTFKIHSNVTLSAMKALFMPVAGVVDIRYVDTVCSMQCDAHQVPPISIVILFALVSILQHTPFGKIGQTSAQSLL